MNLFAELFKRNRVFDALVNEVQLVADVVKDNVGVEGTVSDEFQNLVV